MKISLAVATALLLLAACRYDNEEALFPTPVGGDSAAVSFSRTLQPLLNTYCTSCHGGDQPSGGIILVGYAQVRKYADTGQLLGAISHQAGYSPMPKDGNKLPATDIDLVRRWIEQGALNN